MISVRAPAARPAPYDLAGLAKGLARSKSGRGDLFAELQIVVPKELTAEQRELFERLRTGEDG